MSEAIEGRFGVRGYRSGDRNAVLGLAVRLTEGIAPWRDRDAFLEAARGWVMESMARRPEQGALLVATDGSDRPVGFVSVSRERHFTGDEQAYIGELVVAQEVEGSGIGRLLVEAVESWAIERGLRVITLTTGASNLAARGFYARLGYLEEEVRLTRVLR